MDTIEIQTLIDITNTRAIRLSQGTQEEVDQQRNFVTLLQCIEIRSIVSFETSPRVETVNIKNLGFGSAYNGKHTVWTFRFQTDREAVYQDDFGNPIGNLLEDLHEVPIIKNLTETINIVKPVFDCKNSVTRNTIVKMITTTEV